MSLQLQKWYRTYHYGLIYTWEISHNGIVCLIQKGSYGQKTNRYPFLNSTHTIPKILYQQFDVMVFSQKKILEEISSPFQI